MSDVTKVQWQETLRVGSRRY
ncbi:hypothetical protein PSEUDO8O_150186 [Pseudomonas sp. 8O]|nr:hypothetical protein PSEUDO8O_150186 [Pseudomonas sp. 8O]